MNITKESEELGTPVTLEETTANHDAWWDSLTDKDKEKLFQEQEQAEKYFNNLPTSKK